MRKNCFTSLDGVAYQLRSGTNPCFTPYGKGPARVSCGHRKATIGATRAGWVPTERYVRGFDTFRTRGAGWRWFPPDEDEL